MDSTVRLASLSTFYDLLAHVFGIGAGLGLGQLLAQFQRIVLGLGDLLSTLLCVAGAAARGQEHDKQADEQQDDSLHQCPPFRTFSATSHNSMSSAKGIWVVTRWPRRIFAPKTR